VALGNPLGLAAVGSSPHIFGAEPTLSVGVVSATRRQLPRMSRYDRDYSDLIQTDATINPGNSGGPLVNLRGEVIGINVAIIAGPGNAYGFAIPVNKAKGVLDALIEGRKVVYGWLGIQIQDITDDVAEYYGLSEREGVLVYQVLPESPASATGLKDGDIIKAFDGQRIHHSRELIDRVSATKAGRRAAVEILRDGRPQTLQVEIGERPLDLEVAGADATESWRGLKVGGLSPEQLEQLNLPSGTTGVVVVEVEEDSPAEQAGLRPSDIINEINRLRIESLTDYRNAIAQVKGKALVRTNRGYVVIKAGIE
jgi:serine protease Do